MTDGIIFTRNTHPGDNVRYEMIVIVADPKLSTIIAATKT